MNTRRKLLIALGAGGLIAPLAPFAQQPRLFRVGVLSTASSPNVTAFTQEMEKLGWIDGRNISFESRHADGNIDRLPALASEIVQHKVDVILTLSGTVTQAARRVAGTIPIVFVTVIDPVSMGLVTSRARPGGNITGITGVGSDLIARRLHLLQEVVPKMTRAAVFTTGEPTDILQLAEVQRAAGAIGIDVLPVRVRSGGDLPQALAMLRRWHANSIYVLDASINFHNREMLATFAAENKIPMIAGSIPFAQAGGLISYGSNYEDLSRRAATLVDKILKGARPSDLPVEQPASVELVINAKTARALGLAIPQSLLISADKVIE